MVIFQEITKHYADVYKREFMENVSLDGKSDTLDRRSKSMYALNSKNALAKRDR